MFLFIVPFDERIFHNKFSMPLLIEIVPFLSVIIKYV
jgi:hypothetical protein